MQMRMEIQGRRRTRQHSGAVQDEVRHGSADNLPEARELARRFVSDGFTVWIFQVEIRPGAAPRYRGLGTMSPDPVRKAAPSGDFRAGTTCAA